MAQAKKPKRHPSALKAQRQAERRQARNRTTRRGMREAIRAALAAAKAKDAPKMQTLLAAASAIIDKAAKRGAIHWKSAARKKSKIARRARLDLASASAPAAPQK